MYTYVKLTHCSYPVETHTATHCNKLQHTATVKTYIYIYIKPTHHGHAIVLSKTLQHTSTQLQHNATVINPSSLALEHNLSCRDMSVAQHTATHCNTLQHSATHCNTKRPCESPCNTLHDRRIHCAKWMVSRNTLQHTATHCNTLQHTTTQHTKSIWLTLQRIETQKNSLCLAASVPPTPWYTLYDTLQHTATHCNIL